MPILTTAEQTKRFNELAHHYAKLEADKKELADDMKACADKAKDELGVPPKALKQAAKELGMDSVERRAQHELEEALDACRAALGLLADTPLGQAAQEFAEGIRKGEHDIKFGDDPWMSEQMAETGGSEPVKRGGGRPKGSTNKPKRSEYTEQLGQVADAPLPPEVPEQVH